MRTESFALWSRTQRVSKEEEKKEEKENNYSARMIQQNIDPSCIAKWHHNWKVSTVTVQLLPQDGKLTVHSWECRWRSCCPDWNCSKWQVTSGLARYGRGALARWNDRHLAVDTLVVDTQRSPSQTTRDGRGNLWDQRRGLWPSDYDKQVWGTPISTCWPRLSSWWLVVSATMWFVREWVEDRGSSKRVGTHRRCPQTSVSRPRSEQGFQPPDLLETVLWRIHCEQTKSRIYKQFINM